MEDNYLWDRSGEPDPEIQNLEEILGTLRYQPRPLEIPDDIRIGRRRSFFMPLTIAAAIALCAILAGLWFGFNRRQAQPLAAKHNEQNQQVVTPTPQVTPGEAPQPVVVQSPRLRTTSEAPRILLADYKRRVPRAVTRTPELTPEELAEKQQVLVALRLVSAKLNLAQRKTQGAPQLNTIRNQHKMG
jgi:hypothetical protein